MVLMAGHAILETARDALFLATLPASCCPGPTLIALFALVVAEPNRRSSLGSRVAACSRSPCWWERP